MMTMITEVFGVRGKAGDLILYPKLLTEQFDSRGEASVMVPFADRHFHITYLNKEEKDFGSYVIESAVCDGETLPVNEDSYVILPRKTLSSLSDKVHNITINLV